MTRRYLDVTPPRPPEDELTPVEKVIIGGAVLFVGIVVTRILVALVGG